MSQQQFSQALDYSQKLLSSYQRTVLEITQKLKNKHFSPKTINRVIEYLKNKNYLNDQQYAQQFLEFELKNRPCGRMLCYKKLIKKGISKDLAAQVLDQNYPEEKELKTAQVLAQKKIIELKSQRKDIAMQRLNNKLGYYLKSKGFADSIIIEIIENCLS